MRGAGVYAGGMKILVLGLSGAGKSTWARRLAAGYGVPLLHLDTVHWLPGWVERDLTDERALVGEFLDENGAWVIEGGYSDVHFERRLAEADRIYVLLAPRLVRLWRVGRRWLTYRGTNRPDITEGCPEKLDLEFIKWILWDGPSRARMKALADVRRTYPEKTVWRRWWS